MLRNGFQTWVTKCFQRFSTGPFARGRGPSPRRVRRVHKSPAEVLESRALLTTVDLLSAAAAPSATVPGQDASVSDNGRYVVFSSTAANIVAGQVDTNNTSDIFLLDRQTGVTNLVSHTVSQTTAANFASSQGRISGDGSRVVFKTAGNNLVAGVSDPSIATFDDIYVYEVATGALTLVSHVDNSLTTAVNGITDNAQISGNGARIVFETWSTNLVTGVTDSGTTPDIYLYEVSTGALTLVSHTTSLTTAANSFSEKAQISADGSRIVFESRATDLIAGQVDGSFTSDVFTYNVATGALALVSHNNTSTTITGNGQSLDAKISGDGARIVFETQASNLVTGVTDGNSTYDVFVYDVATGNLTLVSHTTSLTTSAGSLSWNAQISSNGARIVFETWATNLVAGITDNGIVDLYTYEVATGALGLVSHTSSLTATTNGNSIDARISADGGRIVFESSGTNLVAGVTDSNSIFGDIYAFEFSTKALTLLSHTSSSTTTGNDASTKAQISGDGSYVAFQSSATNIVAADLDSSATLFGVALATPSVVDLLSDPISPSATVPGSNASVSNDGRYVVYTSTSSNVVAGIVDTNLGGDVFLLDRLTGITKLVSHISGSLTTAGSSASTNAQISGDGSKIVFESVASNLVAAGTDTNNASDIFVYNVATGAVTLVSHTSSLSTAANGASSAAQISTDGARIVFQTSATDLLAGVTDSNGATDVYVYNVATGVLALVSHTSSLATAGAGASSAAQISGNGQQVVFQTTATDLGAGITDSNGSLIDVFVYEVATATLTLVSHTGSSPTTTGTSSSSTAQINESGSRIVFQSNATNLVTGVTDGNGSLSDVYLYDVGTGALTLVSHTGSSLSTTANNQSTTAQISSDGAKIVFQTSATNLVTGTTDSNGALDLYLYDVATGVLTLVSHTSSLTTTGNNQSTAAQIDADGSLIVFQSSATNFVTGVSDSNTANDVYIYSVGTGTLELVSHTSSATTAGNGNSVTVQISGDGSYGTFESTSTDLVAGDFDAGISLFGFAFNAAPTAVALTPTSASMAENTSTATRVKVADIHITDDLSGTNVLSLIGADASAFEIIGTELYLKAGTVLNFVTKPSYSVTINVDDATLGGSVDASTSFTLTITDDNIAPVPTGNALLASVVEDVVNPPGDTVSSLVTSIFSDTDAGASLSGVAVIGNPSGDGTWQYSTNGTTWFDIGSVGDDATALTLSAATYVRFVPSPNFFGTPGPLTLRLLDDTFAGAFTSGGTRGTVDASINGGTTAISDASFTLGTSVTGTADAPVVTAGFAIYGFQTALLPITRNAVDGTEVTHFRISNIVNGTLTKANGNAINPGDFITAAEATQGVRFVSSPAALPGGSFTFDVQGATDGIGTGLSSVSTANIVVEELSGTWFANGVATRILRDGDQLTIVNRNGVASTGKIYSGGTIKYDVGPEAIVTSNRIGWLGTSAVWTRAALTSTPDLADDWTVPTGQRAHIEQHGAELLLTNRAGAVSRARFTSDTTIFATDWNLVGTFSNGFTQLTIGGKIWSVPSVVPVRVDISGAWQINGQWTQIRQLGDQLTLVDANGNVSTGTIAADDTTITVGALTGSFTGLAINWSDNTTWTRDTFAPPVLSHVWTVAPAGLHIGQVDPNGGELLLTNRKGQISRAVFRSSTEIYAVGWNLVGTISGGGTVIQWSNFTTWNASPSGLDALFADDFNPFD